MDDVLGALRARLTDPSAKGVARAVSRAVRDGTLPPGTRLPPIRSVAADLALSPTTVSAGWALLARAGTIRTDGRRGTTVAETVTHVPGRYRRALERQTDFALDLSTGVPDGRLLPSLQRCARAAHDGRHPGRLPRRARAARAAPVAARRLAVRRRGAHRRRRCDGRARPGRRGRCSASATGSWSSTPASRRCWTCWSRSARRSSGSPWTTRACCRTRWRRRWRPHPRRRSSCSPGRRTPPACR